MYKVVLYDMNTPAFITNHVSYYMEDIEEFQKEWFLLETDETTKERFLKCRKGEYQSDVPYVEQTEEFRMVQRDENCKCLYEQMVELCDIEPEILNGYDYPTKLYIKNIKIFYRFIQFKNRIREIARFELKGICQNSLFADDLYTKVNCYGNSVIKVENSKELPSNVKRKEIYDDVMMKTIAYKEIAFFELEDKNEEFVFSEEIFQNEEHQQITLQVILEDILGEAG